MKKLFMLVMLYACTLKAMQEEKSLYRRDLDAHINEACEGITGWKKAVASVKAEREFDDKHKVSAYQLEEKYRAMRLEKFNTVVDMLWDVTRPLTISYREKISERFREREEKIYQEISECSEIFQKFKEKEYKEFVKKQSKGEE